MAGVSRRVSAEIVVEENPRRLCFGVRDAFGPAAEFGTRVFVAIPALRPMKAHVNVCRRPEHVIGQARATHGAEDQAVVLKRVEHVAVPPTSMPKLDHASLPRVQLLDDRAQPPSRVMKAGRALEKEATHVRLEHFSNPVELRQHRLRAFETPLVRDVAVYFHTIPEIPARLPPPLPHIA